MARADVMGILEAVYDLHGDDVAWIRRVTNATEVALGQSLGTVGLLYEIDGTNAMRARAVVASRGARGIAQRAKRVVEEGVNTGYVETSFRVIPAAWASDTPGWEKTSFRRLFEPRGIRDMFGINGVDPTGVAAFIGIAAPKRRTLAHEDTLMRLSAHVATAYRLRRRLRDTAVASEALLTPAGRVEHAEGEAQLRAARDLLSEATRAIERARGRMRRESPDEAVASWRGLVSARWSLVDRFERDGKRYVVARRNDPRSDGPNVLSTRERQVAMLVVLGHATKLIAYELGLSAATVRVLVARACSKLGVASRRELARVLLRSPFTNDA